MKPPHTRSHVIAALWIVTSLLACTLLTPAAPASPPSPSTPPAAAPTEPPTSTGVQLNAPTPSPSPSGRAWQPAGFGGAGSFLSVHFDPNQPGVVYTASDVAGVMRSTDYGDHWEIRSIGLGNYEIDSFAVDPFDSNTLYAGVGALRESNHAGIYVSHDAGLSWQHLENTASNRITFRRFRTNDAIALDPTREGVIISGSRKGGLWRSTDGGGSWEQVLNEQSTIFHALAVPGAVYVSAGDGNLHRSTDGGDSWQQLTDFPSEDDGDGVGQQGMAIAVDPKDPDHIFFSRLDAWHSSDAGSGVVESTDSGLTWTALNDGLRLPKVSMMTFSPDGALYAGTNCGGVWRLRMRP